MNTSKKENTNAARLRHELSKAKYSQAALAMVGLQFDLKTSLLIRNTMQLYLRKEGEFSLNDAVYAQLSSIEINEIEKLEKKHETSK